MESILLIRLANQGLSQVVVMCTLGLLPTVRLNGLFGSTRRAELLLNMEFLEIDSI
jgi:hypothetical protein